MPNTPGTRLAEHAIGAVRAESPSAKGGAHRGANSKRPKSFAEGESSILAGTLQFGQMSWTVVPADMGHRSCPDCIRLAPGQVLWLAAAKDARAGPNKPMMATRPQPPPAC